MSSPLAKLKWKRKQKQWRDAAVAWWPNWKSTNDNNMGRHMNLCDSSSSCFIIRSELWWRRAQEWNLLPPGLGGIRQFPMEEDQHSSYGAGHPDDPFTYYIGQGRQGKLYHAGLNRIKHSPAAHKKKKKNINKGMLCKFHFVRVKRSIHARANWGSSL